ncbi:hypothetical protein G3580_03715 [Nitrogeniibacter mangrovi]|uniref:Uncharacterized protein n=1 Tax=Nitrogeniibacter mangrovi TaxID=2016596 RepID=A0A6C1AZM8_9RHOO|nr:hypothetical protein [Nitrogeniibacter mangrovi]QID16821.1 hypothetical protein G3580_03715 [Nitrogeniibacter mangrovi]
MLHSNPLAAAVLGALGLLMASGLGAAESPLAGPALSAARLDAIRGGFELPDLKLKLSFGLERAVFVNGELVARTTLNLSQLRDTVAARVDAAIPDGAALQAQVQAQVAAQLASAGIATVVLPVRSAAEVVTPAGASAVEMRATPGAATGAATAQAGTASAQTAGAAAGQALADTGVSAAAAGSPGTTAVAGGTTASVTEAASGQRATVVSTVAPLPVAVIQNGAGNQVGPRVAAAVDSAAIATVIQNSLDNQQIQALTVVNASANSLQVLRAMNFGAAIRQGVIQSLRR